MSKSVRASQIVGVGDFRFCTLLHCTTKREVRRNCGVRVCISRHPCGNSASFPPQGTSTRAKPGQQKLISWNSQRDLGGTFHRKAKQKRKYSSEECETAAVASLAPSLVAAPLVARMLGTISEPWQAYVICFCRQYCALFLIGRVSGVSYFIPFPIAWSLGESGVPIFMASLTSTAPRSP